MIHEERATEDELEEFDNGEYPIEILFDEKGLKYYAGHDIPNQPIWAEDIYDDVDTYTLRELTELLQE